MNITFRTRKLERLANDDIKCIKVLGELRARLLKRRLSDLLAADTLEDLRYAPGHYHELTGDRKGQWACDLDQPYRLVFEPHESPVPEDEDGKYKWTEIKGVSIFEIVDYHSK